MRRALLSFNQDIIVTHNHTLPFLVFLPTEPTDPIVDVANFITYFNETYGLNHPTFYQGSYGQALSDAKQELRFLLMYLHGQDDQDCNQFCR